MRTSELKGGGNVTISPFPCACGCCAPSHTDTCFSFPFLFSYARGRYALIGRFAYHVTPEVSASCDPARLPIRFPFPSHMTLTVLVCVMATRLDLFFVTLTFSCLCFLLIQICRLVSCPRLHYAHVFTGRLVSFPSWFFLCPVFYPTTLLHIHLPDWTLFLSCTLLVLMPVCTCIVLTCIYTGLEMG